MDTQTRDDILSRIPSTTTIREKMGRNARENRLLRSLFLLARRIEAMQHHPQKEDGGRDERA